MPVPVPVPLPVVPLVPEAPLLGGVAGAGAVLGSLGRGAGAVLSGSGVGAGTGAGVTDGVTVDGVAGAALSVVPVESALRFLQPASVAVASIALNSSAVVVFNDFMVTSFQCKSKGNCSPRVKPVLYLCWRACAFGSAWTQAGASVRSRAGTSAEISRAR